MLLSLTLPSFLFPAAIANENTGESSNETISEISSESSNEIMSESSNEIMSESSNESASEDSSQSLFAESDFQASSAQSALVALYSTSKGYSKVYKRVMEWFGTTTNACVAFMSEALRQSGTYVPFDYYVGGRSASKVTSALSYYLRKERGWKMRTDLSLLKQGNIVFTIDIPGMPGVPTHTFMFNRWIDKANRVAEIVDNQGFRKTRYLKGSVSRDQDRAAYALYLD